MQTLLVSREDAVAVVTLNRPERLNAINDLMIDELTVAMREISADEGVRVAIITTAQEKAFCSGMDLKDRKDISEMALANQRTRMVEMFAAIRHLPQPIIAAVSGYTLGGGLEIALNCDFIVASDSASFGLPEVTRGIMPGGGGTQLLPQRIGSSRARELIYTGGIVNAETALRSGLVNYVVPFGELMDCARSIAQQIADNGPIGVRQSKRAINFNQQWEEGVRFEAETYLRVLYSEDRREGFAAFNEKRKPIYRGK